MKRICLLAAWCGAMTLAQNPSADAPDKLNPELKPELRKLLLAVHMDDLLRQQLQTSIPPMIKVMKQNPSVTPQFADEFARQFEAQGLSAHDLTDMIVDAYAQRFTLSEVKDLEVFYNSTTGRKMVDAQPELMSAVAKRAVPTARL